MKIRLFLLLFTIFLGLSVCGQKPALSILHTNDTHSQINPYTTKEHTNVGGYLRRNEVISETRNSQIPMLLLDAGDFSQGTPFFNIFKGDAEIALMNMMGYDVVTLGNHEFDNGSKALGKRLKKAQFEVVCSNYQFEDKNLTKIVKPYVIVEKGDLRIGIFGLTVDIKELVSPELITGVQYKNAIEVAKEIVPKLRNEEKCDLIICLSHLGIEEENNNPVTDILLAETVGNIDIIIGGHTHKLLKNPQVVNGVQILQLENGGIRIGKLDVYDN